jgi:1A family penicillin-binding protein
MNALMIKVLAVGLTLSQLFTRPPEAFKNSFNSQTDQAQVAELLQGGCAYMIKEFNADDMDFGLLLGMMKANLEARNEAALKQAEEVGAERSPAPKSISDKLFKELDLGTMMAAYNTFCKKEKVENSPIKLDEVIDYYNKAVADVDKLDASKLKNYKFVEASVLLDQNDQKFTEVYSEHNRRYVVRIDELPPYVTKAFVAAEDQRFFEHNGLDIRGIVRAFARNVQNSTEDGTAPRPEGGSTITQQVAKNLLTGADLTFERKIKEMILARQLESLYPTKAESKKNILFLYANEAFFGRACWGIECAAQNYFGISAKDLSVAQAATLTGLLRGPNFYHPTLHADRLLDRRNYVLGRMREDGYIDDETYKSAMKEEMKFVAYEPPRTKGGYYFIDEINRQVRKLLNGDSLTSANYTVYSTLHSELQRASDNALRRGLMKYEAESGRAGKTQIVQGNIAAEIEKFHTSWREVLPKVRPRMYDVPWTLAVVTQISRKGARVGLSDGREVSLSGYGKEQLKPYDLIFVDVIESKKNPRAKMKIPPTVQGAVVVLENKTGKVLAMTGGFSYAQSQFNRVTQGARQPGSTLKPFIYLAALDLGYQPNTLIPDMPVEFPGIVRNGDSWTPKNYDGGSRGLVTIRTAIEKSLNLPTARIAAALGETPAEGLDYVRGIVQDVGIYNTTERFYPFVLGAQPARVLNMAVAYATIANLGLRPTPQFIDRIVKDGRVIYQRPRFQLQPLNNSDRVSFYQLRHILEGVLVRGTATSMKEMVGSVGGKTGTSNDERDAWFVGFTNDITVAVWVGYDNRHIRSNLGSRFTGGRVALPIAAEVLRQSFKVYKPMEPFMPPPADVKAKTVDVNIDVNSGQPEAGDFPEIFRLDPATKQPRDTRTQILTPEQLSQLSISFPRGEEDNEGQVPYYDENDERTYSPQWGRAGESYQPGNEDIYDGWSRRPRQIDEQFAFPGFFRGGR